MIYPKGRIVGTYVERDPQIPRAIPKDYWDIVCPEPTVIDGDAFLYDMGVKHGTAREITEAFVKYLDGFDTRCIEIRDDSWNIYDLWYDPDIYLVLNDTVTLIRTQVARRCYSFAGHRPFLEPVSNHQSVGLVRTRGTWLRQQSRNHLSVSCISAESALQR